MLGGDICSNLKLGEGIISNVRHGVSRERLRDTTQ